jgi:hypothetical protein
MRANATLQDKLMLGLDYWLDNDYTNENCANMDHAPCPCSTPGLWNTNWWYNQIGVQLQIGPICLLARAAGEAVFTSEHRARCTRILRRADWTSQSGANTLWMAQSVVYNGLLNGNESLVAAAYAVCNRELHYTSSVRNPHHPFVQ